MELRISGLLIVFTTLLENVLASDDILTFVLNNNTLVNNTVNEIKENSSVILGCLTDPLNPPEYLVIRDTNYGDTLALTKNGSSVFFKQDNMTCFYNETIACEAHSDGFTKLARILVNLNVPCKFTMKFSVNDIPLKNGESLMVPFGSNVNITCASHFPPEDEVILGVRKNKKMMFAHFFTSVIFDIENVNCNTTGTYDCLNIKEKSLNKTTAEFRLLIDRCYAFIITFDFENLNNSLTTVGIFVVNRNGLFQTYNGRYTDLVCHVQTYLRPTSVVIKSYNGSVLRGAENSSRIQLRSDEMECVNNGKMICELKDHLSKGIYSMKMYVWLTSCKPALCHDDTDWKLLTTNTSNNATVSFCFMFNGIVENITDLSLYKKSRLILIREMKWKYNYKIIASHETNIIQKLDFTIVDINNKDYGNYSINLQFSDRKSIGFRFKINIEGEETLLVHPELTEVLSIVLPLIVLIVILTLVSAAYFTLDKMKFRNDCCKSSDQFVAPTAGDIIGSFKYIPLKEV